MVGLSLTRSWPRHTIPTARPHPASHRAVSRRNASPCFASQRDATQRNDLRERSPKGGLSSRLGFPCDSHVGSNGQESGYFRVFLADLPSVHVSALSVLW